MKVNNCWFGNGRICNDLEIRINENGKKMLVFALAINDGTKDNQHTTFIDCVAWENFAEIIEKYFNKGDQIIVAGKLNSYSIDDRGEKRKRVNVVVESFDFGQKKYKQIEENTEQKDFTYDDLKFY